MELILSGIREVRAGKLLVFEAAEPGLGQIIVPLDPYYEAAALQEVGERFRVEGLELTRNGGACGFGPPAHPPVPPKV